MKLESMRYIVPDAFHSLQRNGWMSFAAITTMAITLLLCGVFGILLFNVNYAAGTLESDVEIAVFLEDTVTGEALTRMETTLKALPGVLEVSAITKDDAMDFMVERYGETLFTALGGVNPFPDCYSVKAETPEQIDGLASKIATLPGVLKVNYGKETVDKLFAFTDVVRSIGLWVMVLLAVGAVVLVGMTIRLTVYARRKEVQLMKYVGATDWFIRWPFIIEGALLGMFGAVIAVAVLFFSYGKVADYIDSAIGFFPMAAMSGVLPMLALYLIAGGALLGIVGSIFSLIRFLKV